MYVSVLILVLQGLLIIMWIFLICPKTKCFYNLFMFWCWWLFNSHWALHDPTAHVVKQPTVTSNVMKRRNGLLMMVSRRVVGVNECGSGPVTTLLKLMTVIHSLFHMMSSPLPIHDRNCRLIAWKVSTLVRVNGFDLSDCFHILRLSLCLWCSPDLVFNREERSLGSRLIMEELIAHV